ncbi:helix-turn-helix domain-containing protein [Rhizobium sp. Rhizsp82]|uniref:helix-turn-helix domain-containing protein n=1 Tax=Rhizobium sp. Rhizsp82 TaxID=3243057 RepID=UPI0039B3A984
MSRVWTWRQAIFESKLQVTTKLVLQALASHLNDMGGPMFPSQERLAKLCSLSERSVITHLQIAEDEGWIVASKREMKGSKWAANEHVARWPDGVKEIHPATTCGVKDVHLGGEPASCGGVKEVHTNSPSEHSNEPSNKARVETDFAEFWSAYPNKVGKPRALSAWKTKKPDLSTVLASLRRWKASDQWTKDDGRYIPHPTTWLNREGWNDVIPGEKAAPSVDEMKAAADRIEAARLANAERDRQMVEARRRQLGLTA